MRIINAQVARVEIVSVHVPKTAGGTFKNVLRQVYGSDQLLVMRPRELRDGIPSLHPNIRVIHGHILASQAANHFPSSKMIVWLRHPIRRLISHYYYWLSSPNKGNNPLRRSLLEGKLSLVEFAQSPKMQDFMSKFLRGKELSDYYFIGIQEYFWGDLMDLKTMLGWPKIKIKTKRRNKYPNYQQHLQKTLNDKKIMDELSTCLDKEMKLYQACLELREKRREGLISALPTDFQ